MVMGCCFPNICCTSLMAMPVECFIELCTSGRFSCQKLARN